MNPFEQKWETHPHYPQYCQVFILLLTVFIFQWNREKYATLMWELPIPLFWNGIGEGYADPEWPRWFKKYHTYQFYRSQAVNSILLSNQCQRMKIYHPMSRFFLYPQSMYGILETGTRRKCDRRWTSICRSSVTHDLIIYFCICEWCHGKCYQLGDRLS